MRPDINNPPTLKGGVNPVTGNRPSKTENDAIVFKIVSQSPIPLSVTSIQKHMPHIVERSIRRCIDRLVMEGFLIVAGKDGKTKLYTARNAMFVPEEQSDSLVPFNGTMMSVGDFIELMVDPEFDPFKPDVKLEVYDPDFIVWLRKRFLYPVITAGDSGYNEQLMRQRENLMKIRTEIERMLKNLDGFINSGMWYDHYRDRIAFQRRQVEKENADLIALAQGWLQNNG